MNQLKAIISGTNGAMGKNIADMAPSRDIEIVAGFDKAVFTRLAYPLYDSFEAIIEKADVVIDFSHYSIQDELAEFCLARSLPLVSATTGLSEASEQRIREISQTVPVFRSKNFSYGISVLKLLAEQAAALLSGSFDAEIIEKHHNKKIDSPSGTAQLLAEAVREGAQKEFSLLYGRYGKEAKRQTEELTVHSVRAGSIVGTHEILFGGEGETIRLEHASLSKDVFASGALFAAQYITKKQNGLYTMDDLIKEGMMS